MAYIAMNHFKYHYSRLRYMMGKDNFELNVHNYWNDNERYKQYIHEAVVMFCKHSKHVWVQRLAEVYMKICDEGQKKELSSIIDPQIESVVPCANCGRLL